MAGRSVDVAKMTAYRLFKPFVSVPTSASHDGIASPFVSIKGLDKPHSIKANSPIGVLADTRLLSEAPRSAISKWVWGPRCKNNCCQRLGTC